MVDKIKYAGEEAVSRIADYVNQKLKFVSTMPASPTNGETVLYIGIPTEDYQQGGVYEYNETDNEWILRNLVQVVELTKEEYENLTPAEKNNGVIYLVTDENFLDATELTRAEYEALTPEEKYSGTIYFITDIDLPGSTVEGYYNEIDGKFYEENTYTTEIAGLSNVLYISIDTNKIYRYNATLGVFTLLTGADPEPQIFEGYLNATDGKFYKESTYTTEITGKEETLYITLDTNLVYRFNSSNTTYVLLSHEVNLINGYYNEADGKFYEEDTYTTEIPGNSEKLFIALDTNYIYKYDSIEAEFVQIGGGNGDFLEEKLALPPASVDYVGKYYLLTDEQTGFKKGYIYTCQEVVGSDPVEYEWVQTIETSGSGGLAYVQNLPVSPNIQNVIYGYYATVEDDEVVADDFLDNVEGFDKENDTYLPKNGYTITASSDTLTYKILTSLAKITGGYEATYEDTTNETFNTGDTFYYTVSHMDFYAGDSENQTLYLLAGAGNGGGSGAGGGIIDGYLNPTDGKFYDDPGYTVEIGGRIGVLYLDVSTNKLYRYDDFNAKYILVGDIEYTAGTGIDITNNVISGDYKDGFGIEIDNDIIKTRDFVGTQADWNSLTSAQQAEYDFVHITDDSSSIVYKPGHSISDGTTEKTQRDGLVFDGFEVTDDSTNEVTKIAEIPYTAGDGIEITNKEVSVGDEISRTWTGTKAEWDAISDKSGYDGWIINITDDAAVGSGPVVDVVADGNMNAVTSNATYDALQTIVKNSLVHVQGTLPSSVTTTGEIYTLPDNNYILAGYIINAANPNRKVMNTMHLELYIRESDNKVCAYLDAGGSGYVSNTIDLYFIKL